MEAGYYRTTTRNIIVAPRPAIPLQFLNMNQIFNNRTLLLVVCIEVDRFNESQTFYIYVNNYITLKLVRTSTDLATCSEFGYFSGLFIVFYY